MQLDVVRRIESCAQEGEVLLSPNSRFVVTELPYERDGFTMLNLVEKHSGAPWIS